MYIYELKLGDGNLIEMSI